MVGCFFSFATFGFVDFCPLMLCKYVDCVPSVADFLFIPTKSAYFLLDPDSYISLMPGVSIWVSERICVFPNMLQHLS